MEFVPFPKLPRLFREIVITEKIDGTNACVSVSEDGVVGAQSRTRIITPEEDNFGFAAWVLDNSDELRTLGPGHHFGEWFGRGIQRGYGMQDRAFALFNVHRWSEDRPACCRVVPVLLRCGFTTDYVELALLHLRTDGSRAVPGFDKPEGVVVFHTAGNVMFKALLDNDHLPKGTQ